MTKGRKTIPTKLKVQRGTLEKSRILKNEYEPDILKTAPTPRLLTSQYEIEEYSVITNQLISDGLISLIDMSMVEAYCVEMAKYREAKEYVETQGAVCIGKMGSFVNPWHLVMERSLDRALKIGVMFGVTPSARTKIAAPQKKKSSLKDMLKDGTND